MLKDNVRTINTEINQQKCGLLMQISYSEITAILNWSLVVVLFLQNSCLSRKCSINLKGHYLMENYFSVMFALADNASPKWGIVTIPQ